MDISTSLDFAAEPDGVFAMMTDQAFLEEVCVASQSISYDVSVTGRRPRPPGHWPPPSAARFTGAELTVNEEVAWGGAGAGGARAADLTMTVLGQPVTLKGRLELAPGGRGTVVELNGELKVAIPLLGRSSSRRPRRR